MLLFLMLTILPLAICTKSSGNHFDDFHRSYEREFMQNSKRGGKSHSRRDAPFPNTTLEKKLVQYTDGNVTLTAYVAYESNTSSSRPVVIVVHDWDGRDEFENGKAESLARLGYVGFALDLYGKQGSTPEENQALMKPFKDNRQFLLKRLQLAINEAKKINVVNQNKIGAIGFCFGGMAVLDMARAGWDLKGVVTFHGSLNPTPQQQDVAIKAKILVLHGHDDPGIKPEAVQAFEEEMTKRKADWQVHVYSNTVHAFTVPTANTTSGKYNPLSDKRSWLAMKDFFEEVFI